MKTLLFVTLAIFLTLLTPNIVYAEEIFVITDKSTYYLYDTILFSGEVEEFIDGTTLTFLIIEPTGNIVSIGSISVNTDRTFSHTLIAGGLLWDVEGIYTIEVHYSSDSAQTEFYYYPISLPIELQIDKSEYYYGDTVFVNGTLYTLEEEPNVDISVINPSGGTLYSNAIQVNADLTFDTNFNIEGDSGTYTIIADYNDSTTQISFEYYDYYYTELILLQKHLTIFENEIDELSETINSTDISILENEDKLLAAYSNDNQVNIDMLSEKIGSLKSYKAISENILSTIQDLILVYS